MKFLPLIGLLAFGSMSFAASTTDSAGLSASTASSVETLPLLPGAEMTNPPEAALLTTSADGVINPSQLASAPAATSVPESAGAAFLALFGYILMLRRRTA